MIAMRRVFDLGFCYCIFFIGGWFRKKVDFFLDLAWIREDGRMGGGGIGRRVIVYVELRPWCEDKCCFDLGVGVFCCSIGPMGDVNLHVSGGVSLDWKVCFISC